MSPESVLSETPEITMVQRPHTTDRRILRTKRALRSAVTTLIEQNGADAISVNDLCAQADINRGTFYNHFKDKDDLIDTFEVEVLENLSELQAKIGEAKISDIAAYRLKKKPLPALVSLFDYIRADSAFFHAMLGPNGEASFAPRLRDSVCANLIQCILHERYRENPTTFVNYYVAFYASAYLGVITRWVETGMHESSEDMALIAMRLLFIRPGESIEL